MQYTAGWNVESCLKVSGVCILHLEGCVYPCCPEDGSILNGTCSRLQLPHPQGGVKWTSSMTQQWQKRHAGLPDMLTDTTSSPSLRATLFTSPSQAAWH